MSKQHTAIWTCEKGVTLKGGAQLMGTNGEGKADTQVVFDVTPIYDGDDEHGEWVLPEDPAIIELIPYDPVADRFVGGTPYEAALPGDDKIIADAIANAEPSLWEQWKAETEAAGEDFEAMIWDQIAD